MRVLAVAQHFNKAATESTKIWRRVLEFSGKPVGDRGVIGGSSGEGLGGQPSAQRLCCHSLIRGQFGQQDRVVVGFHDHGNIHVVLGGGPDHGGAADINV